MIKLRKKAPFWCRHKDASGKLDHLDRPLRDDEGQLCDEHARAEKEALAKFFSAPVKPPAGAVLEETYRRIWP